MNKKWIKAGICLGENPTAAVPCPVDPEHGNLTVTDHYVAGSLTFERVLECPKCRAANILRMTYSDPLDGNA
jgi:hypothetical protein